MRQRASPFWTGALLLLSSVGYFGCGSAPEPAPFSQQEAKYQQKIKDQTTENIQLREDYTALEQSKKALEDNYKARLKLAVQKGETDVATQKALTAEQRAINLTIEAEYELKLAKAKKAEMLAEKNYASSQAGRYELEAKLRKLEASRNEITRTLEVEVREPEK